MNGLYRPPETAGLRVGREKQIRFRFDVEGHELIAEGGMTSGKERIFLDGEKISETRSFSRRTSHDVEVGGENYRVEFFIRNPLVSVIRCSLFKGEKELYRLRCTARINKWLIGAGILLMSVLYATFLYPSASRGWSPLAEKVFTGFVFAGLFLLGHVAAVHGEKEVVDETPRFR